MHIKIHFIYLFIYLVICAEFVDIMLRSCYFSYSILKFLELQRHQNEPHFCNASTNKHIKNLYRTLTISKLMNADKHMLKSNDLYRPADGKTHVNIWFSFYFILFGL